MPYLCFSGGRPHLLPDLSISPVPSQRWIRVYQVEYQPAGLGGLRAWARYLEASGVFEVFVPRVYDFLYLDGLFYTSVRVTDWVDPPPPGEEVAVEPDNDPRWRFNRPTMLTVKWTCAIEYPGDSFVHSRANYDGVTTLGLTTLTPSCFNPEEFANRHFTHIQARLVTWLQQHGVVSVQKALNDPQAICQVDWTVERVDVEVRDRVKGTGRWERMGWEKIWPREVAEPDGKRVVRIAARRKKG